MDDELKSLESASAPGRVSFATRRRRLPSRLVAEPGVRFRWSAWLSLQGRLVGAEAATSARSIKGGLGREAAAAWELFSPAERVLLVAIVAAAAKESRREETIARLQRSVDIRDEVLLNMQKKLEDLCEQMSSKEEPKKEDEFCDCGDVMAKEVIGMEKGKCEIYGMGVVEPEERRMSDFSDFSSVTSSVDIQLSTLAQEQDFYNLRKECEEKDAAIKELTAAAHESSIAGSKRILELEEIIRRKNMVITKLKKDMVVLEQKVIQLTRQRRPSTINMETTKLPAMATNLLYDMSSSSPSSSDSDSPDEHRAYQTQAVVKSQIQSSTKSLSCSKILSSKPPKQRSENLDKENFTINRGILIDTSRQKRLISSSGEPKRRRTQQETIGSAPQKRWT
ncbi:uncharacterized protein M6B38_204440 [Iris pallida]|uniref:Uncharacterized protein n=1 Tax=Iris pallida TaxID=29817 RepID=A0AAX6E798_IRIPA|nr:uncharacterized protein M6B38_204435 [Iris pallida]KAJ6799962.1 uncharacterized protein M6B38_204440 [Iris pallida]